MGIRTEGLAKSFAGATASAVSGIDLEVRPGELMALLGPSGSGKTTLLRLVAGLEIPTAGRIWFGDEDATRVPVRERRVGFVFQHYALFRHLTIAGNIGYGLQVRPRRLRPLRREIRQRVDELLDLVQLPDLQDRYPHQLSGGQRQRVALARALAMEPRVLLLDEPFGALDAQVRRDLRRWLRKLHDRTGHTTLFVTHDQEEALELADRVAILNRGCIEQIGSAGDIFDCPASPFVAGFVGDAVRLDVEVRDGAIQLGKSRLKVPGSCGTGEARLFVRPSDLVLAESPGPATVLTRVEGIRRAGGTHRVELVLADGLPSVEMTLPPEHMVQKGDELLVRLAPLRVFS